MPMNSMSKDSNTSIDDLEVDESAKQFHDKLYRFGYGHYCIGTCRIYVVSNHEHIAELLGLEHQIWYHHSSEVQPPAWFLPVMCNVLLRDTVGIEPLIALQMACDQGYVTHPLVMSSCSLSTRGPLTLSADEPVAKSLSKMVERNSSSGHVSEPFTAKLLGNFSVLHSALWEGFGPLPTPWSFQ